MLKTSQSYEELVQRIDELERRLARARQSEAEFAELEKLYASSLKALDVRTREIYAIRSILNMPQLYFDGELRIVGYSGDFLRLTNKVIGYARDRKTLGVLFRRDDLELIREHLERIRALESLPYDEGEKWNPRYQGPASTDQLSRDWLVYRKQENNWSIEKIGGICRIFHRPHVKDQLDCCLMSAREYGGPAEDVKLSYLTRTPSNLDHIRDLTVFISAGSGREELVPDIYGYTACLASNNNTLGRIQKQSADVISRPESLELNTVYQVEVERTGGRITRRVKNLDSGLILPVLEYIDHKAIFDSPNHVGFYTFCGDAQFFDIKIYTRKSRFRIDQFRIPLECEVEVKDSQLKGRVFEIKYVKNQFVDNPLHTLIFNDVTKRRRSEEALRESELRYRRLFEEGRVARTITTRDGRFIDINPEMLALFGYSREEISRIDARDLYVNPGDRDAYVEQLEKKTYVRDYEIKFKKKDGTAMDCLVTSSVHPASDGGVYFIQGSLHDITERKRIEAQLKESQRMEVIGRLASGVAHEVRNPLNAILAISEALIQEIGDKSDYKPYLDHIRTQVDRLSTLMKDLLELGKPLKKTEFVRCPVAEICTGAVELWQQSSNMGGRAVRYVQNDTIANPVALGNSSKLKQVLLNLLENATQHSPEESEIVVELDQPEDGYVRIAVIDRGTGISQEVMQEAFKPFFTTRSRGSGLGLSIVKNIVETHGGRIVLVNNSPPPGLRAEVYLPLCQEVDP